ncbi:MAG TPA: hypothetical protein VG796_08770 [Verrucomicrobiales bacterium]|nr:hypothetical protein [Verrucomicrobiales bacterium]
MKRPLFPRLARLLLLAGTLSAGRLFAADTAPVSLYDKDPAHLWNRVYSALMTRTADAKHPVNDLVDPPLWFGTKHLFEGEPHRQALAVLSEFVKAPIPSTLTPWQRAVMQRDLLGVHHWLTAASLGSPAKSDSRPQRELAAALARAIRHVALTAEEIRKLPDNYSTALAARGAITTFDSAKPAPFLPNDLLTADSPWVPVERKGGDSIPAQMHFMLFFSRSVFEVRFRHPDGREAGEAYLKQLAALPNPVLKEKPAQGSLQISGGLWLNPETPQFPPGSMWALVRRALLADDKGNPVASPLVESAQVRVYRTLTDQTAFEWEARHALLLGNGGFHLTAPEEQLFGLFIAGFFSIEEPFLKPREIPQNLICIGCHSGPGIVSINSRSSFFQGEKDGYPTLLPATRAKLDEAAVAKARDAANWKALRDQWGIPPAAAPPVP